jgi:hypothetical protein
MCDAAPAHSVAIGFGAPEALRKEAAFRALHLVIARQASTRRIIAASGNAGAVVN